MHSRIYKHNAIIIYGSVYGTAKRYALRLSELTGIDAASFNEAKDIKQYRRVIYLGSLYAGSVLGLKKTVGKMNDSQELIIVTVGLVDPADNENISYIRSSMKSQIPPSFYNESRMFHLRGAISYKALSATHRLMMSFINRRISRLSLEKQNAETQVIQATYGKEVDYVDFSTLLPIVDVLKEQE